MTRSLRAGEYVATINGVKLRYRIAGRGPVLMVQPPGWGIGAAPYEGSFAPLEESFTLVYHDPRGSGGSETPADASTLNVAQYAADLEGLRQHLGLDRFPLIGHSHGGLISLQYALTYPGRVTHLMPLAAQLIGHFHDEEPSEDVIPELVRDPAFAEAFELLQTEAGPAIMGGDDTRVRTFLHRLAPIYFKDQRHTPMLRAVLESIHLSGRTVRETSMRDGEFPVLERAHAIRAPTLILAGRYDLMCPAPAQRALARTIPGAKLALFEQSAHFPWVEEPERFFSTVKRFLAPEAVPRQ